MSKTGVASGGKPGKTPSVASKPSLAKRPVAASSKPSLAKRPVAASSKPSLVKRPVAASSKLSLVKRPVAATSKPSLVRRPGAARSDKRLYIVCGVISLLSIATIIVMTLLYINLKEEKSPTDVSMEQLRDTLAAALRRPDLKYSSDMQVAEEVKKLPIKTEAANTIYEEKKRKYKDLFYKTMRSSSSPWKLHGRSLYYFSEGAKTWHDAENFCISRDAHLASVLNDEEQNFITSQLQRTSWIGLTAENKEGTWRWSDGSRLVTQYWSDGEPSNAELFGESSQGCILMLSSVTDHNWNDENCHKLYGWVCKENLDPHEPLKSQ